MINLKHGIPHSNPQIYVACLASYNSGILYGRFIDCTLGSDHVWEEIKDMLKNSTEEYAEEWGIHDYNGFDGLNISENEDIETICELAEALTGPVGHLISDIYHHMGGTVAQALEYINENYAGEFEDLGCFAMNFYEEIGSEIPKELQYYINWDQMGKDMESNGEIFSTGGYNRVHVFYERY